MHKVRVGEPFKVKARDWNDIADAVQYVKDQRNASRGTGFYAGVRDGIIRVHNASATDIPVYTVVELTAHLPNLNYDDESRATESTVDYYTAQLPTSAANAYAVTQEAIPANGVGRAMVYGITPVKFLGVPEGGFAEPSIDSSSGSGLMEGSESGSARILALPTSDNPWGVVMLGCGGGGASLPETYRPFQLRKSLRTDAEGVAHTYIDIYEPTVEYAETPEEVGTIDDEAELTNTLPAIGGGWYQLFEAPAELTEDMEVRCVLTNLKYNPTEGSITSNQYTLVFWDGTSYLIANGTLTGESASTLMETDGCLEVKIGTIYANGRVLNDILGVIRVMYVSGSEALYVEEGGGSSGTVYRQINDESEVTLSRESVLIWGILPLGVIYLEDGTFEKNFEIDWSIVSDINLFVGFFRAITHAACHFDSFVPDPVE